MTIKLALEGACVTKLPRAKWGRERAREWGEREREEKKEQEVRRRDPPFMHHGTAARDNDFFVNYQVAYEAE